MKQSPERLHKYLARAGIASRRKAEELIARGRVTVNGMKAGLPGTMIRPGVDRVAVDGREVSVEDRPVYYAVNKPEGYLSAARDDRGGRTVVDLVPEDVRVYPVGRLDKDSCGLMLLTNDGCLAHRLTHPSFGHEKEYEVLARWIAPTAREKGRKTVKGLEKGVYLDGGKTLPARITIKTIDEKSVFFIIILREGRNRQVRRMCQAAGLKVVKLKRIRIGKLALGSLPPGRFRKVSPEEIIEAPKDRAQGGANDKNQGHVRQENPRGENSGDIPGSIL
jgi:23S rRNA pseudouridine2605 synthase